MLKYGSMENMETFLSLCMVALQQVDC